VVTALIDFTPLWETMRRKQVTQYQLLKNGLDNKTLDTLKKKSEYYTIHIGKTLSDA
jgi:hypothetical protein